MCFSAPSQRRPGECSPSFVDECTLVREQLRTQDFGVLNPNGKWMRRYDGVTFFGLLFTALVTPVEVGFLDVECCLDPLFWINRVVDGIFVVDIGVNFFLAFYDEDKGSMLVKSNYLIARHYLRGWFLVDFLSVIPYEEALLAVGQRGFNGLTAIRLIRLLRLLKLLRVIRVSRVFARYETKFAVSYAKLSMLRYIVILIICAHWMACIWGMALRVQGDQTFTWIDDLARRKVNDKARTLLNKNGAFDQYVRSLYFAIFLITSIGLGDVVPVTNLETVFCTIFMVIGALFWAYTVGNFCSIVSTMDAGNIEFRQRMDELNFMLRDRRFPPELRQKCRMFFFQSKEQRRLINYRRLERHFSKGLRAQVATENNSRWLKKVWYLRDLAAPPNPTTTTTTTTTGMQPFENSKGIFISELSQLLEPYTYAPAECMDEAFTLFILRRGVAARNGRVLATSSVWGEDFLIENDDLVDKRFAAALTYAEVMMLPWHTFGALCEDYPDVQVVIHKARVFYTVRACLIRIGRERLNERLRRDSMGKPGVSNLLAGFHHDVVGPSSKITRQSSKYPLSPAGGLFPAVVDDDDDAPEIEDRLSSRPSAMAPSQYGAIPTAMAPSQSRRILFQDGPLRRSSSDASFTPGDLPGRTTRRGSRRPSHLLLPTVIPSRGL